MKHLLIAALALASFAGYSPAQDSTLPTTGIVSYAGAPASGTSEVDTLTIQTGTSAGTFTIAVAGSRTTTPITWSATDATLIARIDAALEALSIIGEGGVTVAAGSGSSGIGTYTITMTGKNAKMDFPALSIGTNSLTGGDAPTLTTTTPGVAATFKSAPTGQLIVNSSTGSLWQNTSTTANSPTWTEIVGIAVATSADLRAMLSDETGTGVATFATAPTFTTSVSIGSAGVKLSDDADGAITFLGLGNGSDEDLTLNLDDTSNTGVFSSSTGLATLSFTGIGLTASNAVLTPKVTNISGDGAITIASGVVTLSKGSAAAITLAAPSSQDGTRITVVGLTDFAHVITVTGGLWDGTATANTTATFPVVRGGSITMIANGTAWYVESLNEVVCAP